MLQRSEEWFAMRAGKLTSSRIGDALAKTRTGWGASRENVKAEIAIERLTGVVAQSYVSPAMQWGIDHESEARDMYQFLTGNTVEEVGFALHPTIENAGASPDGIIRLADGKVGILEIKCPNSATHIKTLLAGKADKRYEKQINWQMACVPDATFCHFVTFDPRMPVDLQMGIYQLHRDAEIIDELELGAQAFLNEVDGMVIKLEGIKDGEHIQA